MKNFIIAFFICFISISISHATEKISISEFIMSARKVNMGLKKIADQELEKTFNRHINLDESTLKLSAQGQKILDKEDSTGSLTINKLFKSTGTDLSSSVDFEKNQEPSYTLKITQSLAANRFGLLQQKLETIEDLSDQLITLEMKELYEDHLAGLINIYYDTYLKYINFIYARQTVNESQLLLNNVQKRYHAKIATLKDVNLLKVQLLEDKTNYEEALLEYNKIKNQINIELGVSSDFIPFVETPDRFVTENINTLVAESRRVSIDMLTEKKSELNLSYYQAYNLPDFDVYAQKTDNDSEIGFEYSMKIGSTKDKALIEKARWQLQNTIAENHIAGSSLLTSLYYLSEKLLYLDKKIISSGEKVKLYAEIIKEEQEDYNIGRIDLEELVRFINKKNTYHTQYYTTIVARYKTYTEWLRLTDNIVE